MLVERSKEDDKVENEEDFDHYAWSDGNVDYAYNLGVQEGGCCELAEISFELARKFKFIKDFTK